MRAFSFREHVALCVDIPGKLPWGLPWLGREGPGAKRWLLIQTDSLGQRGPSVQKQVAPWSLS